MIHFLLLLKLVWFILPKLSKLVNGVDALRSLRQHLSDNPMLFDIFELFLNII